MPAASATDIDGRSKHGSETVSLLSRRSSRSGASLYHYQRCRHGARVLLVDLRYRRVAALQHHYRQPPRERSIIVCIAD